VTDAGKFTMFCGTGACPYFKDGSSELKEEKRVATMRERKRDAGFWGNLHAIRNKRKLKTTRSRLPEGDERREMSRGQAHEKVKKDEPDNKGGNEER